MPQMPDCFICRKHAGELASPPGGYIYDDAYFRVCHAPVTMAVAGTLLIESRRHALDFAEMTPEESASYGLLLARLYAAVKRVLGAERIYTLVTLEGASHFHSWHIPHASGAATRGVAFLAQDHSCGEGEAVAVAEAVRAALR